MAKPEIDFHSDVDETREDKLERLLAELIDAVVGSSYHDLAGYGYSDQFEIDQLAEIHRAYFAQLFGKKE